MVLVGMPVLTVHPPTVKSKTMKYILGRIRLCNFLKCPHVYWLSYL